MCKDSTGISVSSSHLVEGIQLILGQFFHMCHAAFPWEFCLSSKRQPSLLRYPMTCPLSYLALGQWGHHGVCHSFFIPTFKRSGCLSDNVWASLRYTGNGHCSLATRVMFNSARLHCSSFSGHVTQPLCCGFAINGINATPTTTNELTKALFITSCFTSY